VADFTTFRAIYFDLPPVFSFSYAVNQRVEVHFAEVGKTKEPKYPPFREDPPIWLTPARVRAAALRVVVFVGYDATEDAREKAEGK
jgi:hypothetical protein